MTFGARTLGYLTASGPSYSFNVTTGNGTNTTPVGGNPVYLYGWVTETVPSGGSLYYPTSAIGSASPPTVNGLTVVGVYSTSYNTALNEAYFYVVLVSGNQTSGINSLTVNGTGMASGPTATYDGTNTRFVFTPSSTTILFGTTPGASIPVVLT